MKVFYDTNVLIAASVRQHPHHRRADSIFQRCIDGNEQGIVHSHSLLEFHSAITQLPGGMAVPPDRVAELLREGILAHVRLVSLPAKELATVQRRAGERGLVGGIVYDYYHLRVAQREDVERFYTFNTSHFLAIAEADFQCCITAP